MGPHRRPRKIAIWSVSSSDRNRITAAVLKVLNNLADIKSAGGVALRVRSQ
jgi:hypothetical protein